MAWWESAQQVTEKKRKKEAPTADKKWFEAPSYGQDFSWAGGYSYATPDPEPEPEPAWTKPEPEPTYVIDDPWMQQFDIPTPPVSVKTDAEWEQEWWKNWQETNPSAPVDTSYNEPEDEDTGDWYNPIHDRIGDVVPSKAGVDVTGIQPTGDAITDQPFNLSGELGEWAATSARSGSASTEEDNYFDSVVDDGGGQVDYARTTFSEQNWQDSSDNIYFGENIFYDAYDNLSDEYVASEGYKNPVLMWADGKVTAENNFSSDKGWHAWLWEKVAKDQGLHDKYTDLNDLFNAFMAPHISDAYNEGAVTDKQYNDLFAAVETTLLANWFRSSEATNVLGVGDEGSAAALANIMMGLEMETAKGGDESSGFYTAHQWADEVTNRHEEGYEGRIAKTDGGVPTEKVEGTATASTGFRDSGGGIHFIPHKAIGDAVEEGYVTNTVLDENGDVIAEYGMYPLWGNVVTFVADYAVRGDLRYEGQMAPDPSNPSHYDYEWHDYNDVQIAWNPTNGKVSVNVAGEVYLEGDDDTGPGRPVGDVAVLEKFIDTIGSSVASDAWIADFKAGLGEDLSSWKEAAETIAKAWINGNLKTYGGSYASIILLAKDLAGVTDDASEAEEPIDTEQAGDDIADTLTTGPAGGTLGYGDPNQEGGYGDYSHDFDDTLFDSYRRETEEGNDGHNSYAGDPKELMETLGQAADGTSFYGEWENNPEYIQQFLINAGLGGTAPPQTFEDITDEMKIAASTWAQERNAYALGVVPERVNAETGKTEYWIRGREWLNEEEIMWGLRTAGVATGGIGSKAMAIQMYNNADPLYGGNYMVTNNWLDGESQQQEQEPPPPPPDAPPEYDDIADASDGWITSLENYHDTYKGIADAPVNVINRLHAAVLPWLSSEDAGDIADVLRRHNVTDFQMPDDTTYLNAAEFMTKARYQAILAAIEGVEVAGGWVAQQTIPWLKGWVQKIIDVLPDPEAGELWMSSVDRAALTNSLANMWSQAKDDPELAGVVGLASKLMMPYQTEGQWNIYFGQPQPSSNL